MGRDDDRREKGEEGEGEWRWRGTVARWWRRSPLVLVRARASQCPRPTRERPRVYVLRHGNARARSRSPWLSSECGTLPGVHVLPPRRPSPKGLHSADSPARTGAHLPCGPPSVISHRTSPALPHVLRLVLASPSQLALSPVPSGRRYLAPRPQEPHRDLCLTPSASPEPAPRTRPQDLAHPEEELAGAERQAWGGSAQMRVYGGRQLVLSPRGQTSACPGAGRAATRSRRTVARRCCGSPREWNQVFAMRGWSPAVERRRSVG